MEGWCNFTPVNLISGWYGGAMMQLYTCILGIRLIYWRDDATLHLQTLYLVSMVVGWCNFTPVYLVSGWYVEGMMQLYICIPGIWLIWWWDDATLIFLLQTPNNIEDLLPEIPLPFPVGKQIIRNAECRRENIKETSICKVGDQFITVAYSPF